MDILLETVHLLLRRFTANDLEHLFHLDNDPDVMRYINGGIATPREVIEEMILPGFLQYDEMYPVFGFWAVIEKATGRFLGWFSFRPADDTHREAALGYRFHKGAWGKGYATEGGRALIEKGFAETEIKRVTATTYEENRASRRVMEKLGMQFVRAFRLTLDEMMGSDTSYSVSMELWDGDDVEYALDRASWEAQRMKAYSNRNDSE